MSGRPAVSGSQPEKLVAWFEAEVFEQLDLESPVLVELAAKAHGVFELALLAQVDHCPEVCGVEDEASRAMNERSCA
jgi:hypothetical protein